MKPRSLRSAVLLAPIVGISLLIGLLLAEAAIRLFPQVLPPRYRAGLPAGGLELFYPGILERTPIEGVPLPYRTPGPRETVGNVPRDLTWLGLVDPEQNPDIQTYPGIRFRIDERGFPNPTELERADLLLVGDSFAVAAGVLSPEGLQAGLRKRLELTVFNQGIPGVGPVQEEWLLSQVGLALQPRGVVWLFFGGNDVTDTEHLVSLESRGVRSHGDLYEDSSPPASLLIDLARKSLSGLRARKDGNRSLPGFSFRLADGRLWPIWFNPPYLRALTRERESWEESEGWTRVEEVLARAADTLSHREIRLLVVYLPSKAQIYLPRVEGDPELALRMASFGQQRPAAASAEGFWHRALAHRDSLERLLTESCRRQGIDFLSLTPLLEDMADAGWLTYLSADTHWNEWGQQAAIEPLASWWRSELPTQQDQHRQEDPSEESEEEETRRGEADSAGGLGARHLSRRAPQEQDDPDEHGGGEQSLQDGGRVH